MSKPSVVIRWPRRPNRQLAGGFQLHPEISIERPRSVPVALAPWCSGPRSLSYVPLPQLLQPSALGLRPGSLMPPAAYRRRASGGTCLAHAVSFRDGRLPWLSAAAVTTKDGGASTERERTPFLTSTLRPRRNHRLPRHRPPSISGWRAAVAARSEAAPVSGPVRKAARISAAACWVAAGRARRHHLCRSTAGGAKKKGRR